MFESVCRRLALFSSIFAQNGRKVYLVGGAVRNLLLGSPVKDFDFTTDALPSEVQRMFRKVLPTGLQHGTVTVLFEGESFEVTTFRIDGSYADGRRPDHVEFTPSLEEDLKRRDFTINALALDLSSGELMDFHQGRRDLEKRELRAIGVPGERFDEDALRILRLFRFSSQLDFAIDSETFAGVLPRVGTLSKVSRERVREEILKALRGQSPMRAWEPLANLRILESIFSPLPVRPLSDAEAQTLTLIHPDLRLVFWMTVMDPMLNRKSWETILRGLTLSLADQALVLGPVSALTVPFDSVTWEHQVLDGWGKRERADLGCEYLEALATIGWPGLHPSKIRQLKSLVSSGAPIFVSELAVNGRDLIQAGIPAGPGLGQLLHALQNFVWLNPQRNFREDLIREALSRR